jgi:hypothetical protein
VPLDEPKLVLDAMDDLDTNHRRVQLALERPHSS